MIRRILVGLGGTPYTAVCIETAIELATRHGAELTGVSIVDVKRLAKVGPVPIGAEHAAQELRRHRITLSRERVEQAIEAFTSACRDAEVKWEIRREEREQPFDYMISQARYHDLMILGLRGIFEYGVLGEVYEEASVLLARLITGGVRPIVAVGPDHIPVRRVMIAYSGSMESAKTMKRFIQLRPWTDIDVRIVTFEHAHERAERLLENAARYCQAHGVDAETEYLQTSAKEHLLSEAEEWKADLIVLGNSARSLLSRRVFGETALHAMTNAQRPLFLGQ